MSSLEHSLKKIEVEDGFRHEGNIPYKIFVAPECEADEELNAQHPAQFHITPDTNCFGGHSESLSIFLWKGIPQEFKEVVLFHELVESELIYAKGLSKQEAHQRAAKRHMLYARRHLPPEKLEKFKTWQSRQHGYKN